MRILLVTVKIKHWMRYERHIGSVHEGVGDSEVAFGHIESVHEGVWNSNVGSVHGISFDSVNKIMEFEVY